jgi:hypothetical protein
MRFLALFSLGCALSAQVPDGYVLVTHSELVGSVNSGALTAIDPANGARTEIRLAIGKLNPLQKGVIVHPGDGAQLFGNSGLSTISGVTVQRHACRARTSSPRRCRRSPAPRRASGATASSARTCT